jgi:hypothetical protein
MFSKTKITPSLILSVGAVFLALSGVATALPGTETVNSGDIVDNAIKSEDLKDEKAVEGVDVVDATLTADDLATASVRAEEIGDGIHPHTDTVPVGGGAAENGAYLTNSVTAQCTAGEELVSGHGYWSDNANGDEVMISEVVLNHGTESVSVVGANDSGSDRTLVAVANCLG